MMLFGVGVASATGWVIALVVVETTASALTPGVRLIGVDGAVTATLLAGGFVTAALRVTVTLRAFLDFAGVDDAACPFGRLEAECPGAGPLSVPVSADATAAPATMAAPTPSVTAPALSHIRVLGPRGVSASSA
jgi:hypothetical protein